MPIDYEKNLFDWIADVSGLEKKTRLQLVQFNTDSPARCTLVYFPGASENRIRPNQFDVQLGVYARAENWQDASDDCWLIHDAIDEKNFVPLPEGSPVIRVDFVEHIMGPVQSPGDWEQDLRYFYTALYRVVLSKL